MKDSIGLRFEGTKFWVTHRRREYGPFDYEWSKDFNGVELLFRGQKFGEYCSCEEIYADLKEFKLPMRVVEVTCVVMGSVLFGLLNGLNSDEKGQDMFNRLCEHGHEEYARRIRTSDAA